MASGGETAPAAGGTPLRSRLGSSDPSQTPSNGDSILRLPGAVCKRFVVRACSCSFGSAITMESHAKDSQQLRRPDRFRIESSGPLPGGKRCQLGQ